MGWLNLTSYELSHDTSEGFRNWHGSLHLFLWYSADRAIVDRTVRRETVGTATELEIKSDIPPGPAVDTLKNQLLLGTAATLDKKPCRWQLRRLA